MTRGAACRRAFPRVAPYSGRRPQGRVRGRRAGACSSRRADGNPRGRAPVPALQPFCVRKTSSSLSSTSRISAGRDAKSAAAPDSRAQAPAAAPAPRHMRRYRASRTDHAIRALWVCLVNGTDGESHEGAPSPRPAHPSPRGVMKAVNGVLDFYGLRIADDGELRRTGERASTVRHEKTQDEIAFDGRGFHPLVRGMDEATSAEAPTSTRCSSAARCSTRPC